MIADRLINFWRFLIKIMNKILNIWVLLIAYLLSSCAGMEGIQGFGVETDKGEMSCSKPDDKCVQRCDLNVDGKFKSFFFRKDPKCVPTQES